MYYKFPNAHQPMQNYLPTGGQVPLTHWVGHGRIGLVGSARVDRCACPISGFRSRFGLTDITYAS